MDDLNFIQESFNIYTEKIKWTFSFIVRQGHLSHSTMVVYDKLRLLTILGYDRGCNRHRARFFQLGRKTEEERLLELDEQRPTIKARKQQLESRMREKERKARTKRLIEVGAIFEKQFEIEGQEGAEKLVLVLKKSVLKRKEKIMRMDIEQLRQQNESKIFS
ncbi:hypothetical protein [Metabacillus fastidiosus]|uniref:hypothetical protein n=1 Tax=Metabacillus fastidiosus TaxID=1458 RepID=UPI003D29DA57